MSMSVTSGVPQVRVLVVDDEPHIVEYLQMGFEYEGYAVSVAYDGEEALQLARQSPHDIAILDVMLGEMSGTDVARRLRASDELGIIMLTARSSTAERIAGLDLGADDYVTKPFEFKELLARVRAVLRRRGKAPQHALAFDDITLDRDTHWVTRGQRVIDLTPREFELLALFLAHPRQVLSREVIFSHVWGFDYDGDQNVLEVFIRHLREKLGDEPTQPLHTVRGIGYALR
jgi:two-component system response regulator MprA